MEVRETEPGMPTVQFRPTPHAFQRPECKYLIF